MTATHYLTVRQVAGDLGYSENTIRDYCAQKVFPGATKASDSPQAHWRIPETDVRNFGANRAASRATTLDHKRRKELMAARRSSRA